MRFHLLIADEKALGDESTKHSTETGVPACSLDFPESKPSASTEFGRAHHRNCSSLSEYFRARPRKRSLAPNAKYSVTRAAFFSGAFNAFDTRRPP